MTQKEPSDPMKKNGFIEKRLLSFKYALMGFKWLIKFEMNARIHLTATLLVSILGFTLQLSSAEWLWISFAIVLVFMAELFNSSIESLADALHPQHHPKVGMAKDMGAAATLMAAIFAVVVGLIIIGPKLLDIL